MAGPGGFPWNGRSMLWCAPVALVERWDLGTRLDLRGLEAASGEWPAGGPAGNVALAMNGVYTPSADLLEMTELTVKAPNIQAQGAGTMGQLTSRPKVELKGSLDLDWAAISKALARKVEPNARITGRPRPWRIAGTIDGMPAIDHMGSLEGEIGIQIDSLDIFGMRLSEVPVVLRRRTGRLTVDPIEGQLNRGVLHLEPELVRGKDGSTWLHWDLTRGSTARSSTTRFRIVCYRSPLRYSTVRPASKAGFRCSVAEAYYPDLGPCRGTGPHRGRRAL